MKKALLTISLLSIMISPSFANDRDRTIMINLDNLSKNIVENIKPDSEKITSKINLTHLVAFVKNWKSKDLRKKELVSLYSSVIPKAFKKYPNSREFHLSAYVNSKNEIKNIGNIVVTKEDLDKIDWKSINTDNIKDNKHIKQVEFLE